MKPIGEILIEQGSITKDQLKSALEEQKKVGGSEKRLGEILIRLGVVTEADIIQALSVQFNYPYLPIKNVSLSNETCQIIPREIALQYQLIPVEKIKETLTIATTNPLDEETIKEIEQTTKAKIRIFITSINEIEDALKKYYGGDRVVKGK